MASQALSFYFRVCTCWEPTDTQGKSHGMQPLGVTVSSLGHILVTWVELPAGRRVTGGGGGGTGALTVTRSFAQATSGLMAEARRPRGRGSVKSRVDYMQE
jgi:hypothetical protein